ncbi:hypothetical protein G7Z17_g9954 [Cylindrodendrum hubeiense]|uniref:RRM domain-containing protein n=1 Tax=Cylindrodendrum hubeiense TaxID=595255 RepID=A0A9P5L7N7_9HYPO|nr:hypothetical protein G7Z17_g9954 [Cylindrodendrum hubeiense]
MSSNTGNFWGVSGQTHTLTGNEDPFGSRNNQAVEGFPPSNAVSGDVNFHGALHDNNFASSGPRNGNGPSTTTSLNPATESWIPSAHQALTNVLQMGGQVNDISNNAGGISQGAANGHLYRASGTVNGDIVPAQTGISSTNGDSGVGRGSIDYLPGFTSQTHGATGNAYSPTGQIQGAVANHQVPDPFAARNVPPAPPTGPRFDRSQAGPYQSPSGSTSVMHTYNHRQGTSIQAQPGIPHSHSYNAMSTAQNLLSPGPTPQHLSGAYGYGHGLASPETSGRLTEPRNYAPRTSGQPIVNAPPPKFGLDVTHGSPRNSAYDPFISPQANKAVIPCFVGSGLPSSTSYGSLVHVPVQTVESQRSGKLNELTNTPSGYPSVEVAMDPANFPFVDGPRQGKSQSHGVVKLKNIPFATKRSEIVAFLGRNSKILNDAEEPIHIIMERATSKTMDAYVEFHTLADAMKAAERHHQNASHGRTSRLGDRPVEVELSSQASLMKDLFPIARGIFWDGAQPSIKPKNKATPWDNFKGFISTEEMTMLVKHVESPFSKECPQRPYECLISTLRKFPWYMTEYITITQRTAIYKATCELVRLLARAIEKNDDLINLDSRLFKRVMASAMTCKGFTTVMKDDLAWIVDMTDAQARFYGQPRFADSWTHQYSLVPKPGIPLDWYIAVIREQTQRDLLARPLSERTVLQERAKDADMYWGYFWAEVGYTQGPQFDKMTLAQCAHAELSAVERILSRALPRF